MDEFSIMKEQCRTMNFSDTYNLIQEASNVLKYLNVLNLTEKISYVVAEVLKPETREFFNMLPEELKINETTKFINDLENQATELENMVNTCSVVQGLWWVVAPTILLLGTIGNSLSVLVLCRYSMYTLSTYFYMMVLAIIDEIVLVSGLLRRCVDFQLITRIEDMHISLCALCQVVGVTASYMSVWLIVALTIERLVVIKWPLQAHKYTTTKRAIQICMVMAAIFIIMNAQFFYTLSIESLNGTNSAPRCTIQNSQFHGFWLWVDLIVYSALPFVLLVIINSTTIYKFIQAHRRRLRLSGSHSEWFECRKRTVPLLPRETLQPYQQYSKCTLQVMATSKSSSPNTKQKQNDSVKQLTIMLLCVSITFLVTTLPLLIFKVFQRNQGKITTNSEKAKTELWENVGEMFMYLNHSLNFYLYCASGGKFRKQLVRFFGSKERKYYITNVNRSNENSSNTTHSRNSNFIVNGKHADNGFSLNNK